MRGSVAAGPDTRFLSTLSGRYERMDRDLVAADAVGIWIEQIYHLQLCSCAVARTDAPSTKEGLLLLDPGSLLAEKYQPEHTTVYFPDRSLDLDGTAFASHNTNPRVLPFTMDTGDIAFDPGMYAPSKIVRQRLLAWSQISQNVSKRRTPMPHNLPPGIRLRDWCRRFSLTKNIAEDHTVPWEHLSIHGLTKSQMVELLGHVDGNHP